MSTITNINKQLRLRESVSPGLEGSSPKEKCHILLCDIYFISVRNKDTKASEPFMSETYLYIFLLPQRRLTTNSQKKQVLDLGFRSQSLQRGALFWRSSVHTELPPSAGEKKLQQEDRLCREEA